MITARSRNRVPQG